MSVNVYKQYEDGHVDFKIAEEEYIPEGYSEIYRLDPIKVAEPITFITGIIPAISYELFSGLTFRPLDNHVDFSTADWSNVEDASCMFKGAVFDIFNGKKVYLDFESVDLSKLSVATSMFESIEGVDALLFGDYFVTRGIEDKLPLAEVSKMFYDFKGVIKINDNEGWMNRISAQEDRFARNIFGEDTYISEAITKITPFHPEGKLDGMFSYEFIADPIVVYKVDNDKKIVEFRNITETPELDYLIENEGYKAWDSDSYKDYTGDYTVLTYNHGKVYLPTDAANFFRGVKYSGDSDLPYFDFSYVENATSMFEDAGFSYEYHLDHEEGIFDLSRVPSFRNVKNATRMFYNFDADAVLLPRMFENNADLIVNEFCNLSSKDGVKFGRVNGEGFGTQFIVKDNTGEAAINEYVNAEFNSTVFTTIMRHLSGKNDSLTVVEARLPWEIRELKDLGYKPCTEEYYNTPCYSADDPAYYPVNYFTTTPEDVLVVDYYKTPSFEDVSWMFAGINFTTDCAAQITSAVDFYNAKDVSYAFREATIAQSDYASTIKFKFKTDLRKPGVDWVDATGMFLGCKVGTIIFDEYFTKNYMNKPVMDYMFYECDADIVCPEYVGWEASSATKMFDDSGKDIKLAVVGERFIPKYIPSKYGFFMYKTGTSTLYIAEITDAADYEKYDKLGYTLWTPVSYLHYKRYKIDDIVCNECPDIWIFPEDSTSFFRACTLTENFLKKFVSKAIFGDYIYSGAKAEEYAKLFKSASYGLDGTLSFRRKLKIMDSMFEHTVFEGGKFTFPTHVNTKFIESAFSMFFKAEAEEVNFDSTKWNHDGLIRLMNMERMFYDHKFIINCNDFSGWDNPRVTGRNSKDMFGDDLDAFYAVVGGDEQEKIEFYNGHFNNQVVGLYWSVVEYCTHASDDYDGSVWYVSDSGTPVYTHGYVKTKIFVLRNNNDTEKLKEEYSDPLVRKYFRQMILYQQMDIKVSPLKEWTPDSWKEYAIKKDGYEYSWNDAGTYGTTGLYSAFDFGKYNEPRIILPTDCRNLFRGILFDSYGMPEGVVRKYKGVGYNATYSDTSYFNVSPAKDQLEEEVDIPEFIDKFYRLRDGSEVKGFRCLSFPYMNPSWAYDLIARQLDFSKVQIAVDMFKDFGSSVGSYDNKREKQVSPREAAIMLAGCHIGQLDLSGIDLGNLKHADRMFEDLRVGELIMKNINLPNIRNKITANGMFRSSIGLMRQSGKKIRYSYGVGAGQSRSVGTDILNIILTIKDGTQLRDHVIDDEKNNYDTNITGMFGVSNYEYFTANDPDSIRNSVYHQALPWKNASTLVRSEDKAKHGWMLAKNGAVDTSVDPINGNFKRADYDLYLTEHNIVKSYGANQVYGDFTISNKDGDYKWRGSWNPNMSISNRFQYNPGMQMLAPETYDAYKANEDTCRYARPFYYSLRLVDDGVKVKFPSNCYGLFAQFNSMQYENLDELFSVQRGKSSYSTNTNYLTQGLLGMFKGDTLYDVNVAGDIGAKNVWPASLYQRADMSSVEHADFMLSSFAVGYNYLLDRMKLDIVNEERDKYKTEWITGDDTYNYLFIDFNGMTLYQKDHDFPEGIGYNSYVLEQLMDTMCVGKTENPDVFYHISCGTYKVRTYCKFTDDGENLTTYYVKSFNGMNFNNGNPPGYVSPSSKVSVNIDRTGDRSGLLWPAKFVKKTNLTRYYKGKYVTSPCLVYKFETPYCLDAHYGPGTSFETTRVTPLPTGAPCALEKMRWVNDYVSFVGNEGVDHLFGSTVFSRIFDDLPEIKLPNATTISGLLYETKTLSWVHSFVYYHTPFKKFYGSYNPRLIINAKNCREAEAITKRGNTSLTMKDYDIPSTSCATFNAKYIDATKLTSCAIAFVSHGLAAVTVGKHYDWNGVWGDWQDNLDKYKITSCFSMFYPIDGRRVNMFETSFGNEMKAMFDGSHYWFSQHDYLNKEIKTKDIRETYRSNIKEEIKTFLPITYSPYPVLDHYNDQAKIFPFNPRPFCSTFDSAEQSTYGIIYTKALCMHPTDQGRIKTIPLQYAINDPVFRYSESKINSIVKEHIGFFIYEDETKLYYDKADWPANGTLHFSNDPSVLKQPSSAYNQTFSVNYDGPKNQEWIFNSTKGAIDEVIYEPGTILPRNINDLFYRSKLNCTPFTDDCDTSRVRLVGGLYYRCDRSGMPPEFNNLPMRPFDNLLEVSYMFADSTQNQRDKDLFSLTKFRKSLNVKDRYDTLLLTDTELVNIKYEGSSPDPDVFNANDYYLDGFVGEMYKMIQARYFLARCGVKALDLGGFIHDDLRRVIPPAKDSFGNYVNEFIIPYDAYKLNLKGGLKGLNFKNKNIFKLYFDYNNLDCRIKLNDIWREMGLVSNCNLDDASGLAQNVLVYYSENGFVYEPTKLNKGESEVKYKLPKKQVDTGDKWLTTDCYYKVDNEWYKADVYTKVNGEWKLSKT